MGFVLAHGRCIGCNQPFSFNPMRVPSVAVAMPSGERIREPICRLCVERVNPQRRANGLPEIIPAEDAYDACDEGELPYD